MNDILVLVEVKYIKNTGTGKVHRVVRMPDTGQILKGEQCNLDQLRESDVLDTRDLEAEEDFCEHCFGDSAS